MAKEKRKELINYLFRVKHFCPILEWESSSDCFWVKDVE